VPRRDISVHVRAGETTTLATVTEEHPKRDKEEAGEAVSIGCRFHARRSACPLSNAAHCLVDTSRIASQCTAAPGSVDSRSLVTASLPHPPLSPALCTSIPPRSPRLRDSHRSVRPGFAARTSHYRTFLLLDIIPPPAPPTTARFPPRVPRRDSSGNLLARDGIP